jgi:D-tagatose-1,6-bisphosphate aldolase subunit GatZ/KbaZ
LAAAAEAACPTGCELVYVIGTEVPVPGGAQEHLGIQITSPAAAAETIELTRQAFFHRNLQAAWERVTAVVVQPGVEFGDDFVLDYKPESASTLSSFIESQPGLVYEAHSTDYQTGEHLRRLVHDHFAILKVGPELTYAYREAVFKLAQIENELIMPAFQSRVLETIEAVMLMHPDNWQRYYRGSESERAFARKYSLSDRIRYYWPQPEIRSALERMRANLLSKSIPLSLLSQYFPGQYEAVRAGEMAAEPNELIASQIRLVIHRYSAACGQINETQGG